MAKCYITGIEIPVEEAYLLNIYVVNKTIRDLKSRFETIQRLLDQLGPKDEISFFSAVAGKQVNRMDRRLVCNAMAQSLAVALPEEKLFITWPEYKQQRALWFKKNHTSEETEKCKPESE